jgi:hypothetical protein
MPASEYDTKEARRADRSAKSRRLQGMDTLPSAAMNTTPPPTKERGKKRTYPIV